MKLSVLVLEVRFIMVDTRRWTVEAKEFELMIKGGRSGVTIVERRNGKQRSVFIHRDELTWLVEALELVVDVETSEVFWDQARAGYPRLITQKCSNRHGRFLTIEEFDGRKRSGSIFIPEGRHRKGWAALIAELRGACSSLRVGRVIREEKKVEAVAIGIRSYAEVAGLSKPAEEERFHPHKNPIDAVLKEAATRMGVPARVGSGREKVQASTQPVSGAATGSMATGGIIRIFRLRRGS